MKKTIPSLKTSDHILVRKLVEKCHVAAFKANEVILSENEEDNVQLIVLKGNISMMNGERVVSVFFRNQVVGSDVCGPVPKYRKFRNYCIKSKTDSQVMLITRNAFQTAKGFYDLDKERTCHRLLQKVPIMRDWPLTKIVDISEHFKSISFEPGEVIYDLGSKSDAIFFVQEG